MIEPTIHTTPYYDSTMDTVEHIKSVNAFLAKFVSELLERGINHDASKFGDVEKPLFDLHTPELRKTEYGSQEYYAHLKGLEVALRHHYANNSHHPEFYHNGIKGMNLFDVIEMFCDWCAAVGRTKDGNILKSIDINKNRFLMSDQLYQIFINTVYTLGINPPKER